MTRLIVASFLASLLGAGIPGPGHGADGISEDASVLERWQADPTMVFSASEVKIEDFKWEARPIVVFANTDANPLFQQQLELLEAQIDDLVERDVVLITDTDPEGASELRRSLRPRGFMLTLIGKDGTVKLRKPRAWDVRELSRSIDKMPLRQDEIRRGGR